MDTPTRQLFENITAFAEEAPDLPAVSVAARFNTFLTSPGGLGLVVRRRRGQLTNLFRTNEVMQRIREGLEFFGDHGDHIVLNLEHFFNGNDSVITFEGEHYNIIAVLAGIILTAPAPNPASNTRLYFEISGVSANGDPFRIWRPLNQHFARYATNAIWAFLRGGRVSFASDFDIEEKYVMEDYEVLQGGTNITLKIIRLENTVGEQSVGGFWRFWLDERFPESLADLYQVCKESEKKEVKLDMEKGVEIEPDLYSEADCLGYTLFRANIGADKLKQYYRLNAMNNSVFFPSNKLGLLHTQLKINIAVRRYSSDKRKRNQNVTYYPKKLQEGDAPYIYIGRLMGHYFLDEETGWTNAGSKNFLANYEFLGEEAKTHPPSYFYDKNHRASRRGQKWLEYRSRGALNLNKKLTVGELLCNLTFGTTHPIQQSLMKPMKLNDYMMKTECFLHFKDQFRNQNLSLTEDEFEAAVKEDTRECEKKGHSKYLTWADGHTMGWKEFSSLWSKGGVKLDSQPSLMTNHEYPEIEKMIKTKRAKFTSTPDWGLKDRFGVKASMVVKNKEKSFNMGYFIPLKYTFIAFDTETYVKESDRTFIPYLASICYYEKNGKAFDFREWSELEADSCPVSSCGATLVKKSWRGDGCCDALIDYVTNSVIFEDVFLCLAAHNLNFDLSMLIRNTSKIRLMEGVFKSISKTNCCDVLLCPYTTEGGFVKGRRAYLLDTYPVTVQPLDKFARAFGLQGVKKQMYPYAFYSEENVRKFFKEGVRHAKFEEVTLEPGQDIEVMKKAAEVGECLIGDESFDPVRYAEFYCEEDCHTLIVGMMKHRVGCYNVPLIDGTNTPCRLDVLNCISIPQYASHYLGVNGCFTGAYELCGTLRDYVSRSVVGGRCMVEANIPHLHGEGGYARSKEEEEVEDFDACSLYPTSEVRGCSEEYDHVGYPVGKPKLWTPEVNLLDKSLVQYYITVRITKVGKYRRFPLFPSIKPSGGRHWSNDVVGKEFVFDKVQWEDAQEFQEAEGEIICGVYFNEGGNKGMGECMKFLYQERLRRKKKEKEHAIANGTEVSRASSDLCKLIMNSSYGRLIMKPIGDNTMFCYGDRDFHKLCFKHHHTITEIAKVRAIEDEGVTADDTFYVVKKKELVRQKEHFSLPHWGAFVLSESKRVMNEVMYTAEDAGCRIHYQDTDSMHIVKSHLPKLKEELNRKYGGRQLGAIISGEPGLVGGEMVEVVPEAMGRFHGDFAPLVTANEASQYEAPVSRFCAFVGKKMYYDRLIQRHKTDPSKNKDGAHAKMKGISDKSLKSYAKECYPEDDRPVESLYRDLMMVGKHSFDLVGHGKLVFKPKMDGTITKLESFIRCVGMQVEDAKLALQEWRKFFPEEECPNPFLDEAITAKEVEEEDEQSLAQELDISIIEEDEEEEEEEEEEDEVEVRKRKRFMVEVTREEAEEIIDPHVGDDGWPTKRRRVFCVDEYEDEFIGGERVSDLMDIFDIVKNN